MVKQKGKNNKVYFGKLWSSLVEMRNTIDRDKNEGNKKEENYKKEVER